MNSLCARHGGAVEAARCALCRPEASLARIGPCGALEGSTGRTEAPRIPQVALDEETSAIIEAFQERRRSLGRVPSVRTK